MGSDASTGRLRGELTEFVGRRAELAQVRQALSTARLVTLTGPGGIGKTRLATEVASGARRAFRDGVWLAELGGLHDPALLVAEVARSLGLSDQSARWGVAALSDYLADRQLLLVLDGCEHLADGCAVIADALLRGCPGLRIMATSRHVLRLAGEVTVVVPPMTVPAETGPACPEDLMQFEAVRLFAGRAAAVLPGFALDAGSGPVVAEVCRRLDGIPLAVELAAVRLRSLSPEQILARLESRFPLLSGGSPADMPHRRTLRAALEWSYELLTEAEKDMWRRVSVFAGSFDLDAAEAVCGDGGTTAEPVIDLVDGLVAKSILIRSAAGRQARYRLLDTIGEFGLAKLRTECSERELRARHREWYAALAAKQEMFGPRRAEWISRLDTEHENLRAALEFCLSDPREAAAGATLACDLWRYWETHGHLTEGRRVLSAVLEKLDPAAGVRPRALWVAGFLALVQGDLPAARTQLEAGLTAAADTGDARSVAYASSLLGYVLYSLGEADRGRVMAQDALRLHQQAADQAGVALALTHIGFIHLCSGETQVAADRFAECAALAERTGNIWHRGYARWGLAVATWLLGYPDGAAALVRDSLRSMRVTDDPIGVAGCLSTLAWIAATRKRPVLALTLAGAADAAWAAIPAAQPPALRGHDDAARSAAGQALPEGEYQAALAKGRAMSRAEAVALALGESPRQASRKAVARASAGLGRLTRRERDVVLLVARGMSNSQIAATLVISARTVETHMQHIMDKLGVGNRAQIAAWSAAENP